MSFDYILLTPQPALARQVSQHVIWPQDAGSAELFGEGFSLPQDDHGLMLFQDVDSHVDGFGWALLMLVQGQGEFQLVRNGVLHCIEMAAGSVLIFDNRDEHGFMPAIEGLQCAGLALELSPGLPDKAQAMVALKEACARHYASSPTLLAKAALDSLRSFLQTMAESPDTHTRLSALAFLARVVEVFEQNPALCALRFMRNQDPRIKLSWGTGQAATCVWEASSPKVKSVGMDNGEFMDLSFPNHPSVEECRQMLDMLTVQVPTSASSGIHRDVLMASVHKAAGPHLQAWLAQDRATQLEAFLVKGKPSPRLPRM